MAQASREAERQRQADERAQIRAIRAREQAQRAAERAHVANEREAKKLYAEAREQEAAAQDAELASHRAALETILQTTLAIDDYIDLDALKEPAFIPPFDPGELDRETPKPDPGAYVAPALSVAQRFMPGAKGRHQQATDDGKRRFERDVASREAAELVRVQALADARKAYDREVVEAHARAAAKHAEIDAIKAELAQSSTELVKSYFEMVLGSSSWPDGFPQQFVLAYDRDSKLLAIDYMLPDWSVVPEAKGYRYVKARDEIDAAPETPSRRKALYTSLVAQSTLRVLHEVLEADRRGTRRNGCLELHGRHDRSSNGNASRSVHPFGSDDRLGVQCHQLGGGRTCCVPEGTVRSHVPEPSRTRARPAGP